MASHSQQPTQLTLTQLRMDAYIQKLLRLLMQMRTKFYHEASYHMMQYLDFGNAELLEMATLMATTMAQFLAIGSGVTQSKLRNGRHFVAAVSRFVAQNPPARLLRYQRVSEPTD
ncbi:hypothetical protein QOT17_003420 [Balamuthia mandrillaris]